MTFSPLRDGFRCGIAVALAALSSAAVCQTPPAAPLGRLFLHPDARLQLERQRQLNFQEARSLAAGSVRLDGVVVRSSGQSTVWINQQPVADNDPGQGVAAATSRQHPGQAVLTIGDAAPAELKVGATLDRATRETADGLAGGGIRVIKR